MSGQIFHCEAIASTGHSVPESWWQARCWSNVLDSFGATWHWKQISQEDFLIVSILVEEDHSSGWTEASDSDSVVLTILETSIIKLFSKSFQTSMYYTGYRVYTFLAR